MISKLMLTAIAILATAAVTAAADIFAGINDDTTLNFATSLEPQSSAIKFIPVTGDIDCGINNNKVYTHAIDFGNDLTRALINEVQFQGAFDSIAGTSATVGTGWTSIPTSHSGDHSANPYLNGYAYCAMEDLVKDMVYNDETAVINITGLTSAVPYQLRLYHRSWLGNDRSQIIGFDTDGMGTDISAAEDTAVFDQDKASKPDPGFATDTQVYALAYDYVLSPGVNTLVIYINKTGIGTYHLYGLTNEQTDNTLPEVDAGSDWVTWSGRQLTANATVINNTSDPVVPLIYEWTVDSESLADPNLSIAIFDSNKEDASVEITKLNQTGDATVVTMTLSANNQDSGKQDIIDSMEIHVYDDACKAGIATGSTVIDSSDFNGDCITDFKDFAELALKWLEFQLLDEPFVQ